MDIGKQLKEHRTKLNISVPKLAVMLGIPKDRIYKWEKGTRPSDPIDHQKIINFINGNMERFPEYLENIPLLEDAPIRYGNVNLADFMEVIKDQQKMLSRQHETMHAQHETLHSQQETIKMLVGNNHSKKAS